MSAAFDQYCAEVAELYLGLDKAIRKEAAAQAGRPAAANTVSRRMVAVLIVSLAKKTVVRRGGHLFKNLQKEDIATRKSWHKAATAVLNRPDLVQSGREKPQLDPELWEETPRRKRQTSQEARSVSEQVEGLEAELKEREDLAQRLQADLDLLNDLLHALDRGDETYFLYLTRRVGEINTWLKQNYLLWSKGIAEKNGRAGIKEKEPKPETVTDEHKRVSEAWPWTNERAERTKSLRASRAALKQTSPTFADATGKPLSGDEVRRKHEDRITAYFEFCRQYEFQNKIKAWKDAPDEAAREREESGQEKKKDGPFSSETARGGESLEDLIQRIFRNPSKASNMVELADLLFGSPHEQSKLALLLGMPPSRWLLEEERSSIVERRRIHGCVGTDPKPREVTGLCFSGGGIRSATFNLGILQALAELHLLEAFDYLSTVSGGGYIHQWIAAWWKRASESSGTPDKPDPHEAFQTVNKALIAQPASTLPGIEPTQISFLRRFSNYLTPQLGAFSGDTWTLVAIWTRNTFLNQLILFSGFLAVFAALRGALLGLENWRNIAGQAGTAFVCFSVFLVIVVWRLGTFSREVDRAVESDRSRHGDGWIAAAIFLLLLSALVYTALCVPFSVPSPSAVEDFTTWLWRLLQDPTVLPLAASFVLWPMAMGLAAFTPSRYKASHPTTSMLYRLLVGFFSALFASALGFVALASAFRYLYRHLPRLWCYHLSLSRNGLIVGLVKYVSAHHAIWRDLIFLFVPPVLVVMFFLVSVLHIGLNRAVFRDEVLEWMARLRAWVFVICFAWLGLGGCLILSAPLVGLVAGVKAKAWSSLAAAAWAAISGGGAAAAKGGGSKGDTSAVKKFGRQALVLLAPYIFIVGVFVGVSAIVALVSDAANGEVQKQFVYIAALFAGAAFLFGIYGQNVDINEFSMHSFYRNRLARCYQGASVIDRRPDGFTGFSSDDRAIRLGDLRCQATETDVRAAATSGDAKDEDKRKKQYPGPFPIFSCTLNFTSGEDLAYQERKGASFAFTPLYSGYDIPWTGIDRKSDASLYYNGFRDTLDMANPHGPGLADVSAISGAAASPNSGYRTSPGLAFLMTCFNVRLGVWKRNTRYPSRSAASRRLADPDIGAQSPAFAPWHLLLELFGKANAKNKYLYLSDGGHFDNMGLYELVRRECRYIVVCDAEEDGNLTFGGMALALRKCRTDFGVEIDLDLRALRTSAETGFSNVHCVVGTILYPNEDPETPGRDRGKIVYLKSSLTGAEPADILAYKLEHDTFPHDTTADQWFSESQFESYRVLGRFIGINSLKPACEKTDGAAKFGGKQREFFNYLYDIWYPAMPAIERHLSKHGEELGQINPEGSAISTSPGQT